MGQQQRVPSGKGLHELPGLGRNLHPLRQQRPGLPQKAAAARHRRFNILRVCLGEVHAELIPQNFRRQGLHIQFGTPGTHCGQQLIRVVRQQQEHAVGRRLLQHLQKGVLARQSHVLGPGKLIDFVLRLIGLDEHIRPGLPN